MRRYRRQQPRRQLIRTASHALHKLGLIEVGDRCADCGGGPIELHHPDYSDRFHVVPLCRRCHMRRHADERRRARGVPMKYVRRRRRRQAGRAAPNGRPA